MCNRNVALLLAVSFCSLLSGVASAQPTLTTLHDFDNASGSHPVGGLIFDTSGALYGATEDGGASNAGTIFKLTPPAGAGSWTKTVLYVFRAGADGAHPVSAPVFDSFGALYGATASGGSGSGVVFKLTPPAGPAGAWTKTILHKFTGGGDGKIPSGRLLFETSGGVLGMTQAGGGFGGGTLARLPSSADEGGGNEILLSFRSANGARPVGAPIFDTTGALYGSASAGGSCCGAVFKLSPPQDANGKWIQSVLHAFAGGRSDGVYPNGGLIFDSAGALYGVTRSGGIKSAGTVFQLTPPQTGTAWTYRILHHFQGGAGDGAAPVGALLMDNSGALYGATREGGASGNGTIFKLSRPSNPDGKWAEKVLYRFTGGSDGGQPTGDLVTDGSGAIFGLTARGGASNAGTIFRLSL